MAVLRHSGTNAVLTSTSLVRNSCSTAQFHIHPIRRTIQHADSGWSRRGEKVVVEVSGSSRAGPDTLVTQETNSIEIEAEALSTSEQ